MNGVITQTIQFVKQKLSGEGSGHDWWHIHRVHNNAILILQTENNANHFIVEMAALLHDVVDPKVDSALTLDELRTYLEGIDTPGRDRPKGPVPTDMGISPKDIDHILHIVDNMSYSKNVGNKKELSLEGQIVQDADRLDAIGAIGIARCFTYGGSKGREMYNPEIPPENPQSTAEYQAIRTPSINHFYEKLLKLKDLMNTESAKRIARQRHTFMEAYLDQFYAEWNGQR